ncbi:hypothetical protein KUV89_03900 [Marinobacter hydrocarbonoclasticus]|nr:hypothetical protein [Marinobacter nauticus]
MNQYLTSLFDTVGIDIKHLKNEYLSRAELECLNSILKSEQDLERDFYTSDHGENLECLLFFLRAHKTDVLDLMRGEREAKTLVELYTSSTISANYDCFRFNLTAFPQTYIPRNKIIILYRIGRTGECADNLGCSWSRSIDGLRVFSDASGISNTTLKDKPMFTITINDSQVLFEGVEREHELVLKPGFSYITLTMLNDEVRKQIGR